MTARAAMITAAIYYLPEAFHAPAQRIFGRQAAGDSFFRAWLADDAGSGRSAFVRTVEDGDAFVAAVGRMAPGLDAQLALPWRLDRLREDAALFVFEPRLADHAWRRRRLGAGAYSLCGLTHTMVSHIGLDAVAELAVAPLEPWDALICTSRAVKAAVDYLLESQFAYLAERLGARRAPRVQTPVLPLGIEARAFASDAALRAAARRELGVDDADLLIISHGRQSLHGKANPLPLFVALERAVALAPGPVHLLLAGWLPGADQEAIFRRQAAALAPSITLHLVAAPGGGMARWLSAADLFVSLVDNYQESFGLAPIEAMAAGLPVVVSDWDGFRDTVEHGVQGFRIPTLAPPGGVGADLALRYAEQIDDYDAHVGAAGQFVAVDVAAAAEALAALLSDAGLRGRMGAAGAARAHAVYDWRAVLPQYKALWGELSARRAADGARGPWPARPDPFAAFAAHPSRALAPTDRVTLGAAAAAFGGVEGLRQNAGAALAAPLLPSGEELRRLVHRLSDRPVAAADLIAALPSERRALGLRGLAWLAKFDLVRIAPTPES